MVVLALGEFVHEVFNEGNVAQQVIQRNVEEALNLGGVEIHGQNAVGTGGGEHVGHQLGGDGVTGLGLPILAGVAKVGDDGSDTAGGRTTAGVDHHQQLHEIVIDGFAGGLDEEHVGTADGFLQGDGSLSVGKVGHNGLTHGYAQLFADGLRKLGIGIAAENLNVFTVSNHRMNTSLFLFFCPRLYLGRKLTYPLYHSTIGKCNMNKCVILPKKAEKIKVFLAKKTEFRNKMENEILFVKYLERFLNL